MSRTAALILRSSELQLLRKAFVVQHSRLWQAMQLIIAYDGSPEDYVRDEAHRRVERPKTCPNCSASSGILSIGYYFRSVTCSDLRTIMAIQVRRFRCSSCPVTTSMLPDFALTYRLVETDIVSKFLSGIRSGPGLDIWAVRLADYQRRFERRMPLTQQIVSDVYGLSSNSTSAVELWEELCGHFGGARQLAARLAMEVGVTVFGIYRCHHPPRKIDLHRMKIFPGGRDPPIFAHLA